MIFSNPTR